MANLLLSTRHLVADVFFRRASAHACGRVPPSSPASRCGLLGGRAEAALPLGVALFKTRNQSPRKHSTRADADVWVKRNTPPRLSRGPSHLRTHTTRLKKNAEKATTST